MSTLALNQRQAVAYHGSTRLAMPNYQQSTVVAKKVDTASRASSVHHRRTRDMVGTLTAKVQRLQVLLGSGPMRHRQSGRDLSFFGEHSDMILAHLLPLQGDLDRALDSMIAEYSQDVSTHDINWLQSEFRHLVDSTAQERAARHPESTAHAFDQWSYPEDTIAYFKDTAKHQTARSSASSIMSPGQADADSTTWTLRQRRKTPNQT
jgi:hypothetical protein